MMLVVLAASMLVELVASMLVELVASMLVELVASMPVELVASMPVELVASMPVGGPLKRAFALMLEDDQEMEAPEVVESSWKVPAAFAS